MTNPLQCSPNPNSPSVEANFPSTSSVESRQTISSLCEYGLTPQVISGCLLTSLKSHFADPTQLLFPTMRARFADIIAKPEQLYIDSLHRWKPEHSEHLPAILVRESDWESQNSATINDFADTSLETGGMSYLDFWQGSHVIFALSSEGGEALQLGTEVQRYLAFTSKDFQKTIGLHKYRVGSLSGVKRVKESNTVYTVAIGVNYIFEQNWTVTPVAPRLKRVKFSMSQILRDS